MTGLLLSLALLGQVQVEVQPETVVVVRPQTYTYTTTVTVPARVLVVPAPKIVVTTKSYIVESPIIYREVIGTPILRKRGLFGRYLIVK
jgi:hypothetical protein